jgi:hypothetical protein
MVGNFGSGIAWIDPVARSLTPLALPAAPVAMSFLDGGELLIVLDVDGWLHAIDVDHGELRASLELMPATAQGAPRPSFALYGDHVFVTDPAGGAIHIVEVDAHGHHDVELELRGRFSLPFAPGSAAPMAIPGAVVH